MKRRTFIQHASITSLALSTGLTSCNQSKLNSIVTMEKTAGLNISLAQWSLNKAFFDKTLDPKDFAKITKSTFDISAVEYVNQFYKDEGSNEKFWNEMKHIADNEGVQSLLIMVDDEGDLGHPSDEERIASVENHYKWVNAAKLLGCHSIRVNAFGEGTRDQLAVTLADGLGRLAEYAAKEDINVLIENHGLQSSDAAWIVQLIKNVNAPNLGTLPDFGNWCTSIQWGGIHGTDCENQYDIYKGVEEFLPYAKGVSAKAYSFNEAGEEATIDYSKMISIVKNAKFKGYIGIEYEGNDMTPNDGITATKKLLEKYI